MRSLLVLLVLVAALVAQEDRPVRKGEDSVLPDAGMIYNARFGHFDETFGKAVVYVWFLPDSGGRGLASKLNALHARYGKKGLVVAAISHRDEEIVEKWVERNRPRFAVAWEPSNLSMGRYGFMQWPSSVLVSPRGKVLWMGGGASPPTAAITKALKTAMVEGPGAPLRLVVKLPPALKGVQSAMERGLLDKALGLLKKAGAEAGVKSARERITDLLDRKLGAARREEKRGDYHRSSLIFGRLAAHAPKSKWGAEAAAALALYKKDPRIKQELAGGAILTRAQAKIDAKDWKGAEKLLKKLTTRKYEGTKVRDRAEILLLRMK